MILWLIKFDVTKKEKGKRKKNFPQRRKEKKKAKGKAKGKDAKIPRERDQQLQPQEAQLDVAMPILQPKSWEKFANFYQFEALIHF
jgi:hypothetical protein